MASVKRKGKRTPTSDLAEKIHVRTFVAILTPRYSRACLARNGRSGRSGTPSKTLARRARFKAVPPASYRRVQNTYVLKCTALLTPSHAHRNPPMATWAVPKNAHEA
eukprot:15447351-Alexandrium_andersonii.AAC.1